MLFATVINDFLVAWWMFWLAAITVALFIGFAWWLYREARIEDEDTAKQTEKNEHH